MSDAPSEDAKMLFDDFQQAVRDRYGAEVRLDTVIRACGMTLTAFIIRLPREQRLDAVETLTVACSRRAIA